MSKVNQEVVELIREAAIAGAEEGYNAVYREVRESGASTKARRPLCCEDSILEAISLEVHSSPLGKALQEALAAEGAR